MENKIKTIIVDDEPLARKGLAIRLAEFDDIELVEQCSNGEDAMAFVENEEPDLIILDLNMQGMDGLDILKAMRNKGVTSRIVMLTVSDNDEDVVEAIRSGADGYLLKDMDPEDIVEKVRQATLGKMVISEKLTDILATALRRPNKASENPLSSLTSREQEILKYVAKGLSNKLIARELNISDGTVKVHVKHLLKKLGLRSRVEAAVWMVNLKTGAA